MSSGDSQFADLLASIPPQHTRRASWWKGKSSQPKPRDPTGPWIYPTADGLAFVVPRPPPGFPHRIWYNELSRVLNDAAMQCMLASRFDADTPLLPGLAPGRTGTGSRMVVDPDGVSRLDHYQSTTGPTGSLWDDARFKREGIVTDAKISATMSNPRLVGVYE